MNDETPGYHAIANWAAKPAVKRRPAPSSAAYEVQGNWNRSVPANAPMKGRKWSG